MIVWTHAVWGVLYACVLYFCTCTFSMQLSMSHMERHSRNTIIIIIFQTPHRPYRAVPLQYGQSDNRTSTAVLPHVRATHKENLARPRSCSPQALWKPEGPTMHCHLHWGDWSFHPTNEKKKIIVIITFGTVRKTFAWPGFDCCRFNRESFPLSSRTSYWWLRNWYSSGWVARCLAV